MKEILEAQQDMRKGYGNGSLGIIVSGIVWLLSALAISMFSTSYGIRTLIIGGIFIFPLGLLLNKIIGLSGKHHPDNPMGKLAMEGTVWMIACIPLAYGLSLHQPEWFFQGMLIIIGGRYLTFASIYGLRWYWLLGGALVLSSYVLFGLHAGAMLSAFTGGVIEVAFGFFTFLKYRQFVR